VDACAMAVCAASELLCVGSSSSLERPKSEERLGMNLVSFMLRLPSAATRLYLMVCAKYYE